MTQDPYLYDKFNTHRYIFTSLGKNQIVKAVDFTPTSVANLYSLGFGDVLPDGSINDLVHSNNGDILKVLSTVVQIARDFTFKNPAIKIVFTGSTEERTRLYARILKMYYEDFHKDFRITGFVKIDESYKEIEFNPDRSYEYLAFFIKRIQ